MSATGGAPGRSSSGVMLRPSAGWMPSTGRKVCSTGAQARRTGWFSVRSQLTMPAHEVTACIGSGLRRRLAYTSPVMKSNSSHGIDEAQRNQAVGLRVGQAAENDAIHHAEDRRGGADADRRDGDDGDGEGRRPKEVANGVAQVLEQPVQQVHAARGAALLLDLLHAAEFAQGGVAGLIRGHSGRDVLLRLSLHVEADLGVEFRVCFLFSENVAQAFHQVHRDVPVRRCP